MRVAAQRRPERLDAEAGADSAWRIRPADATLSDSNALQEGRLRLPLAEPTLRSTPEVQALCDELLQRTLTLVEAHFPAVAALLGHEPTKLQQQGRLVFSRGEPAINVYTCGGKFTPHEDCQTLTLLLPLSPPTDFCGGGTAFWSTAGSDLRADFTINSRARWSRAMEGAEPSLVLRPPAGTGILFGGDVTHAGVEVDSGTRVVFVASFSAPMSLNAPDDATTRRLFDHLVRSAAQGLPPPAAAQ